MNPFPSSRLLVCGAVLALSCAAALADTGANSIKFSDPSKPGTLKISIAHGGVQIEAGTGPDVVIKSEAQPQHRVRNDGLRVLTEAASYALSEKDNVVTLDANGDGWMGAPSEFHIMVPRTTNVVIASALGGEISCTGIAGDLEIKCQNGEIRLNDVSGGALVETMNGEINANVRELHDGKSLSFTSTNGQVQIRLPADAKANIRLRTQNGSILTDFDEKALVTKVEAMGPGRHGHWGWTQETQAAFREMGRAAAVAGKQAAEAARQAMEAARDGFEEGQDEASADGAKTKAVPAPPKPPTPPVPPAIPTVTGGKLVTGTLNGGGPEINVALMNGDVTLRKLDK